MKVVLALRHRLIPPSLHFVTEHPKLGLSNTPFYVNTQLHPWSHGPDAPRRAAVSAFGFSGTNCHVVLEEAPPAPSRVAPPDRPAYLFPLSARTDEALRTRVAELERHIAACLAIANGSPHPGDIGFTLAQGRAHQPIRRCFVARDLQQLHEQLSAAVASWSSARPQVLGGSSPLLAEFVAWLTERFGCETAGFSAETLPSLAEAYSLGIDPSWAQIYPPHVYRLVKLPTYPFARERHGGLSAPRFGAASEPCEVLLGPAWQPAPDPPVGLAVRGTVLVVARRSTIELARSFAAARSEAGLTCIVLPAGMGGDADDELDLADHAAGVGFAHRLLARYGACVGVLDLSDLDGVDAEGGAPLGKLGLLQVLVDAARGEGMRVLHVTASERAGFDWSAAVMASLVGKLGAEYTRVNARTLDLDLAACHDGSIAAILLGEWCAADAPGEVRVNRGRREIAVLASIPAPGPGVRLPVAAEGTYLITGGVRGLGLKVAEHLVARGARSLALCGLQPLPPPAQWDALMAAPGTPVELRARLAPLAALLDAGVRVLVHEGAVSEEAALGRFLDRVRRELGPIRGVFHCAGVASFDHPAFVRKPAEDLVRVLAPKVAGLRALARALSSDSPELIVLFSSVSSLVPRTATSLLDYGAANGVMNRWAAAHPGGRCVSIAWTNWTGAGMGEVAGAAYHDLGFETHDVATGLRLLERAAMAGSPVVLPAKVDPARFSTQALTALLSTLPVPPTTGPTERPPPVTPIAAAPPDLLSYAKSGIRRALAEALMVPEAKIDDHAAFQELGVDSILLIEIVANMERWLGRKLQPGLLLDYQSVMALATHICREYSEDLAHKHERPGTASAPAPSPRVIPAMSAATAPEPTVATIAAPRPARGASSCEKIAIIGMACNFPGARDLSAYWDNLRAGRHSIREVPASRWSIAEHYAAVPTAGKSISRHGGFLDDIESFAPSYFEMSELDAPGVDPLVRQFLEVSVQCVRHAGYERSELAGRNVGVFVGSRVSNYAERILEPTPRTVLGVGQNFIAAHLSQLFDMTGPNMVIDTACSSSLTSLHVAAKSLTAGECELAIAGGVDILLDEKIYLWLSAGKALSPDGRCFVFDERANGFVPGEGAGALLLKPLERALVDGDTVYAVLEASAMNNDGRTMGVTTPNPVAQKAVIEAALTTGGIRPDTIGYIEAHGTGTAIGDPIELKALTEVFRALGGRRDGCGVGSVKSNLGHLLSAAGVASVIKVALALGDRHLPPTLHCERPNPRFRFEDSPFAPVQTLRPWEPREGVWRAGISGFGFGGTNVHVILGGAPAASEGRRPLPPVVFVRNRYWLERPTHGSVALPSGRPLGKLRFNT